MEKKKRDRYKRGKRLGDGGERNTELMVAQQAEKVIL